MTETGPQKAFKTAYTRLNLAQKKAVDTIEGPVMVVAGPGTGKTQILTLRIARILEETQANPEDILALTFTNSGVRAMRDRLRSYIGDAAYRVNIFTFHSFAEHVLKEYSSYFPEREFAEVITELEKVQILEHILDTQDFSKIVSTYDRFSSLTQVMNAIDNIKQEGLSPTEFEAKIPEWEKRQLESEDVYYKVSRGSYKKGDIKPAEQKKLATRVEKMREIGTVYQAYQREIKARGRYDFSDMILTLLESLESDNELKLDLAERYQYILVDEHQDTNEGQNKLIEALTTADHLEGHPNLFTVGDEKQSIYRFQGASEATFKHFLSFYKDVEVIDLTENYRSTAPILEAAHGLITHSLPDAVSLDSNHNENALVEVREFSDYKFELLFVASDIKKKLEAGVKAEEIAIIYRSNKHLDEVKLLLEALEVPYHVRAKDSVLDDPRILHLHSLCNVVADPSNNHELGKLLFADFLNLNAIAVTKALREFRAVERSDDKRTLLEFLETKPEFASVARMVSELVSYDKNHHFVDTFRELLNESGYLEKLLQLPNSRIILRKIEVLFNELKRHAERTSDFRAKEYCEFIKATEAYRLKIEAAAASVGGGVVCVTAHSSKGLEFEHVYVINTTSKNWEKSRGFSPITLPLEQYQGDIHDERRLFYVALTRAKTYLYITSASSDWQGKDLEPSRFISELAETAVTKIPTNEFETAYQPELASFLQQQNARASVFAVEYLWQRFQEENLSVTSLNNYIECPIKYLFRNLIQLPDVFTPALRYGDAVHRALEQYFKQSVADGKFAPKEKLLREFEQAMSTAGFFGKEYERFNLKGRQSLGQYYDYYKDEWRITVASEEYIRRTLSTPYAELTLSGKIDKIEYLDEMGAGPVRIIDYKTGKSFSKKSSKAQREALERQIHFYYLLMETYKDDAITVEEAVLDFVEPTDDQEFEKKVLTTTTEDQQKLKTTINEMTEAIKKGTFLNEGCQKKDCEHCALYSAISSG